MSIKTILVALGLDDDSEQIAGRAVQLAHQHDAQLVGIHIIEDFPITASNRSIPINSATLDGTIEDERTQQLRSLLRCATDPVLHVEYGNPHEAIERWAASCNAQLIVIGPGTARTLREKLLGSTAERVVRRASCPVLVVHMTSSIPYRKIMIGVDFSDHTKAAVFWATRLSPMASREFIHAVEFPLPFEQAMLKASTSQADIARYRDAKIATAREQVLAAYGENGQLPKGTRINVTHGDPASILLNASRRKGFGLLALGTQGSNALVQHLLGSVARKVLQAAKCDVLAVPATAFIDADVDPKGNLPKTNQ